jgi:chromosomal replication initiation ATPase DnaA
VQPQNVSVNVKPPVCSDCAGKGYYRYDVPLGHVYFGRYFPCPACNADAVTHNSGLNPQERKISLEDIETENRPGAQSMMQAARTFLSNGCKGFLTIHGDYGNGKSTVMKGMVNACLAKGIEARYITMTEVMVYAREAFESAQIGDTDYGRIAKLAAVCVLFIDELDKARITDYAREVQTHLFDVRYRRSEDMGTVVAWNGTFNSLDLPWVRSRLSEFTVIENKDADMRPLIGGMA